jgi:hypothetical protein
VGEHYAIRCRTADPMLSRARCTSSASRPVSPHRCLSNRWIFRGAEVQVIIMGPGACPGIDQPGYTPLQPVRRPAYDRQISSSSAHIGASLAWGCFGVPCDPLPLSLHHAPPHSPPSTTPTLLCLHKNAAAAADSLR